MATPDNITIRDAKPHDIPQVNAILSYYALNTIVTFATVAVNDDEMLEKYNIIKSEEAGGLPYIVATKPLSSTLGSEESEYMIVGYAYLYPYQLARLAYKHTAELSIYLHPDSRDQGLGSALLDRLLLKAKGTLIREIIAIMSLNVDEKDSGLWLRNWYVRRNFREVGMLKHVGWKFEKWIDTMILQLSIATDDN